MAADDSLDQAATQHPAIDAALSRSGMLSDMETGFVEEQRRAELEPGRVLSGRFEIVRLIGAGGMGAVYEAKDRILAGKAVALKVMLPSLMASEQARRRFTQEAMLTRELRHPGIVNVFDVGMDGDLLFLTMELVEGESANDWRRKRGGKVDAKNACGFMHKVAEALRYAHENNVIHRDLKPQNILVIHGGQIRLVDFGLARAIGTRGYARTQAALGTPYYMAPEQSRNSPNVDARADVYSCGVILYQLVTGELPMGVFEPPSEVDGRIPTELDDLVNACLQRRRERRLASAKEMLARLEEVYRVVSGQTSVAGGARAEKAGEPSRPARRRAGGTGVRDRSTERQRPPAAPPAKEGPRIVVADSDPGAVETLRGALSEHGYDVRVAADGEAAVRIIREHRPDLAIVDLKTDKLGGFQVIRTVSDRLNPLNRDVWDTLFFMTCPKATGRDKQYAISLGVRYYMVKPIALTQLVGRIETLLGRSRSRLTTE